MMNTLKKGSTVWYREGNSDTVNHRVVLDISPNGACAQLGVVGGTDYIWIAVDDIAILDQTDV